MRYFVLLSITAFLTLPAAVQAHARLLASNPAAKAVTAPTSSIELRFSERLVAKLSSATVVGVPGATAMPATVKASGDGKSLTLGLAHPLPAGTYRVEYHVTSADTHRVDGTLTFRVK